MEKRREIETFWEQAQKTKDVLCERLPKKSYDLKKQECYMEFAGNIPMLRFEALRDISFVNAAFSTRFGGVSQGDLAELNFGFDRGEPREHVEENYRLFCNAMGMESAALVLSDQIHDTRLHIAKKEDACGAVIQKRLVGIDGLLTEESGLCLATSYADCVPLFFVDRKKGVIASSHSGWRGTAGRIGEKTVAAMVNAFSSDREDITAVIGPSICQFCYEVSREVIEQLREQYTEEEMQEIAYCSDVKREKYQLDLWAANYFQLKQAGLLAENIHVAGICTCCNSKLLFSHRATKGKRGNMNGFIAKREEKYELFGK